MANELLDSTGARIERLRKKKRLTQKALGRLVGVGHVYISQLESGTRNASRGLIALLAFELGTSRAFLEMDTDDPTPPHEAEADAPCYFSEEADAAAKLIDAMQSQARREEALALVRVVAAYAQQPEQPPADEGRPVEPVPGAHGGKLVLRDLAK